MEKRILVYNNRTKIVERVAAMCREEQLSVLAAEDEGQLYDILEQAEYQWTDFQLMLVDVEMGDTGWDSGIEMIIELRRRSRIPLIVVSGQSAETAKIMALNAGADDYVTTDCNPLVLLAKIKSQIRRYAQLTGKGENVGGVYGIGGLILDDVRKKVMVDGRTVRLTPMEYKILHLLMRQRGKVLSNSQIYESIWNMKAVGVDNTIAVHICHLREKIEEAPKQPKYLKVVWGNGYKIE